MTRTDEVMIALRTGCHRAPDLPFSDVLDMAMERARGCRLRNTRIGGNTPTPV